VTADDTAAADVPDLSTLPPPNPADRVVRLPAAAAIVVSVVLLAVIAVGAIVSITEDRPLTGPPVDPPPPPGLAKIAYDPATRKVSFEEMHFIAPAAPFACDPGAREVSGVFTSVFSCHAVVHRNYDKKNSDWTAEVTMGRLDDRRQIGGNLASFAWSMAEVVAQSYPTKVTVKNQKTQRLVRIAPDDKAVLLSAELQVSVPNLPTTHDRLALAVFELQSGQHVVWFSLLPNDSPKDVVKARTDAAGTVTVR
jgi:hypothetical protein